MHNTETIRLYDQGVALRITVLNEDSNLAENISSATTKTITFRKPLGTTTVKSGAFSTDGTDGRVQYVTESGFIDEVGLWKMQVYVDMGAGKFHSTQGMFFVEPDLN